MDYQFLEEIPHVLKEVLNHKPSKILIIGDKQNIYSFMINALIAEEDKAHSILIDGLKDSNQASRSSDIPYYQNIYYQNNVNEFEFRYTYDIILFCNQLQHYDYEKGLAIVQKLISNCKQAVIVTTPTATEETFWSIPNFSLMNFSYQKISSMHLFTFHPPVLSIDLQYKTQVTSKVQPREPMTIAYLLPHKNLTGGMKMLLQQIQYLKQRGHRIYAIMKTTEDINTIHFDWAKLEVDKEIIIPMHKKYIDYIEDCDIIVCGWLTQLLEIPQTKTPVVYWEQGNEWLFGDIVHNIPKEHLQHILKSCYLSPHYILSVSQFVSNFIRSKFGRSTPILTNGIDTTFYHPGNKKNLTTILLVGNPALEFKGFAVVVQALNIVWQFEKNFQVKWACQVAPSTQNIKFPIELIVKPAQETLAQLYRESTIRIFGSWYEGFGMPPLEAMASGTAVICTRCGGIDDFVQDYHNALTVPPGDVRGFASRIILLLRNQQLRAQLEQNGLQTALQHDYTHVIQELEEHLYTIIEHHTFSTDI